MGIGISGKHVYGLAVGFAAVALLSGCAATKIKQLSGPEFQRRAEAMSKQERVVMISGFAWQRYIGHSK